MAAQQEYHNMGDHSPYYQSNLGEDHSSSQHNIQQPDPTSMQPVAPSFESTHSELTKPQTQLLQGSRKRFDDTPWTLGQTPGNRGVGEPNLARSQSVTSRAQVPQRQSSHPHTQRGWHIQPIKVSQSISPTICLRQPYSDTDLLGEQLKQAESGTPQMIHISPSHWTESLRRDAQQNAPELSANPIMENYSESEIQRQLESTVADTQNWYDRVLTEANLGTSAATNYQNISQDTITPNAPYSQQLQEILGDQEYNSQQTLDHIQEFRSNCQGMTNNFRSQQIAADVARRAESLIRSMGLIRDPNLTPGEWIQMVRGID
ncbi:hypothetical protein GYMLUDRAFT_54378 [Collybiopsis luxurians FD-317 M1]|nr:hypothetical protein GYMLUDRAFT_54378 [Collybiopsis luxurians FD-317 M1]